MIFDDAAMAKLRRCRNSNSNGRPIWFERGLVLLGSLLPLGWHYLAMVSLRRLAQLFVFLILDGWWGVASSPTEEGALRGGHGEHGEPGHQEPHKDSYSTFASEFLESRYLSDDGELLVKIIYANIKMCPNGEQNLSMDCLYLPWIQPVSTVRGLSAPRPAPRGTGQPLHTQTDTIIKRMHTSFRT